MNKIKVFFTTGAFALALVLSFAFKPAAAPKFTAYYSASVGAPCTTITNVCTGGSVACKVATKQAYTDMSTCTTPAFTHN